jgi:hypothetical protein
VAATFDVEILSLATATRRFAWPNPKPPFAPNSSFRI